MNVSCLETCEESEAGASRGERLTEMQEVRVLKAAAFTKAERHPVRDAIRLCCVDQVVLEMDTNEKQE